MFKKFFRWCKRDDPDEETPATMPVIEQFVDNILGGDFTAECQIPIADYHLLYDALVDGMKKYYNMSDFEVSESIWQSLSATCPRCHHAIDGPKLGALGLMYNRDSPDAERARRSPTGSRFVQGLCPNEGCPFSEISIRWHVARETA